MSNYIDEEDVKILMDQGNISREESKKLLKKYLGDIVKCLLQINNYEEKNNKNNKNNEDIKNNENDEINDIAINDKNLLNYRNIIDEKEYMYKNISEKKEKNKKKNVKLDNEELYYLSVKGNFTSIRVL